MTDHIYFDIDQSIVATSGDWYRVVQRLGVGGNSVTYLVMGTQGSNKGIFLALKVFRRLSDPARKKRFLEEVSFLQNTDHPAIMRVYDTGEFNTADGVFPFVVAEYLPIQLYDVIRANRTRIPARISYAVQLLAGLQYLAALEKPVVHRDIKPRNIFVKGGSCVLGDFGLMKVLDHQDDPDDDRELLKESYGPGMPFFYRTPDLISYARGEGPISTKSDVFQLGLVLTELFTGRNPARRTDDILDPLFLESIGTIPGSLGASIANLLQMMLETDPLRRREPAELLDPWQGAFRDAVEMAHKIDGRVI